MSRLAGPFWGILFLLVPLAGFVVFVLGAWEVGPFTGHWLSESQSDQGDAIDHLFYLILALTGVVFVATGVVLGAGIFLFDGKRTDKPANYFHGSAKMEIAWAIAPAIILVFLSFYQMQAWADAKLRRPLISSGADGVEGTPDDIPLPAMARVVGRKWEWRFIYAGRDGVIGTPDDLRTVNELVLPYGEPVVLELESQDVLHSFFIPALRTKQDVVPGMRQTIWFNAREERKGSEALEIACAELCGDRHYAMRAKLTLLSRTDYDAWIDQQYDLQHATQLTSSPGEGEN